MHYLLPSTTLEIVYESFAYHAIQDHAFGRDVFANDWNHCGCMRVHREIHGIDPNTVIVSNSIGFLKSYVERKTNNLYLSHGNAPATDEFTEMIDVIRANAVASTESEERHECNLAQHTHQESISPRCTCALLSFRRTGTKALHRIIAGLTTYMEEFTTVQVCFAW